MVQENTVYFKTYIGHCKPAQQETANFLSYYNFREDLNQMQAEEVFDLEKNQLSTYSNYYEELSRLVTFSARSHSLGL